MTMQQACRTMVVLFVVMWQAACFESTAPRLAPDQREAQQTLDRIARARSAVRWFDAVRTTLEAFEATEASLASAGRVDPLTHARIEEWIGIVQDAGIAVLGALQQASKEAQDSGRFRLNAEAVRDLAARVATLAGRVATIGDQPAWSQLHALIESSAGLLRMVLQILDPEGLVPLDRAADVTPPRVSAAPVAPSAPTVPAGVPTSVIPLRVYGPRLGPIPVAGGVR